MEKYENIFAIVYFSVFAALVLGSWLFTRRLDAKAKKKWQPRLVLLAVAILGPFFVLPMLILRIWLGLGIVVIFLVFFVWLGVFKTRVCEACGTVTQPQNLVRTAEFCPKCGEKLTASPLFGSQAE